MVDAVDMVDTMDAMNRCLFTVSILSTMSTDN
jgi:hypothetical protein